MTDGQAHTDEHARKVGVQTVAACFMPVATIAVMLRCYVRARVVRAFGLDDGAMVFAAVGAPFPLHFP
jgi:hypothetical protein